MKRLFLPISVILLFLHTPLGPAGCGGTETGNPGQPGDAFTPGIHNPALLVMEAICTKLTSCMDLLTNDCRVAVIESSTLVQEFGAFTEQYPSFADLLLAVDRGDFEMNMEALNLCISSVEALTCDNVALQAVVIDENGTQNLEQMIPDAGCPLVFGAP
jgi:hypothetical protein